MRTRPRLQHQIEHLIVDRDGVLNRELASGWVVHRSQWTWEKGALEALRLLTSHNIRVSIATNQSCVGRELATREQVDSVHRHIHAETIVAGGRISAFYVCPHAPDGRCQCRKPRPGLLLSAVQDSRIPIANTAFVGDASRDLEAGQAAGMEVFLVRTGKGRETEELWRESRVRVFGSLLDVARFLTARSARS